MAKPPTTPAPASGRKSSLLDLGVSAVRLGELDLGERYLEQAVHREPRNAAAHLALAEVYDGRGKVGDAICAYADVLAVRRDHIEAAQRLASLTRAWRLEDAGVVNPIGLAAALRLPGIDHQPLAELVLRALAAKPAIASAGVERRPPTEVATWLAGRAVLVDLASEATLAALAAGINTSPAAERLLVALRKAILLAVGPEQLTDRGVAALALGLAAQADANGYVWPVSDEERVALAENPVDAARALSGDVAQGLRVLKHLLYAPAEQVLGAAANARQAQGLKPHALRDLVVQHLAEREETEALAAATPRQGSLVSDTSQAVKRQYEAYPYPRWRSLARPAPGGAARTLARYIKPEEAGFLARPFQALVAGAGTGRQPAATALSLAPNGRVTAVDLSRASLAWGARMAKALEIANLEFVEADLTDASAVPGPFALIECVGVLHHMADPFAGWRGLNARLAPGGIMLVGLYSALARRAFADFRAAPDYPGPDCDDDAARAFRQRLLAGPEGGIGAKLARSVDFHTMAGFRDLVLHPAETTTTLEEIAAFLAREGLEFRGFALATDRLDAFAAAHAGEAWPGRLETWAAWERAHPATFEGMYVMWVRKPG